MELGPGQAVDRQLERVGRLGAAGLPVDDEDRSVGLAVDGVDATPDDLTVEIKLSEPNAVMPLLPIPIVPEHIWKDVDEDEVKSYANEPTDGQPVVGSGPFELVEGTAGGSTYRFEVRDDYWKGDPHIDQVVLRVFKSSDAIEGATAFAEKRAPKWTGS